ncbi:MAG: SCO family protein [Gammaproteobacteria bacterium]|nr:SCO family protein [Gammaproteobacteria bacterium]
MAPNRTALARLLGGLLALFLPLTGLPHEDHAMQAHPPVPGDPHAAHRQMLSEADSLPYLRSENRYATPAVTLTDSRGAPVPLAQLLDADEPVILSFIYTSCTTICPVLTATLSQAQDRLAKAPRKPRLVSISIDPDFDTPARLQAYAATHHAHADWHFLTGDAAAVSATQRAFDVYRGRKSNHIPVTLLRASAHSSWVRLEGFTSAVDLVREYERLLAN